MQGSGNRLEDKEKLQKAVAEADILANATIVGMKPDLHEETLIPKEWMRKDLVVADIVYNPEVTRMLKEAREAGCQTIEGKGMMLGRGQKITGSLQEKKCRWRLTKMRCGQPLPCLRLHKWGAP